MKEAAADLDLGRCGIFDGNSALREIEDEGVLNVDVACSSDADPDRSLRRSGTVDAEAAERDLVIRGSVDQKTDCAAGQCAREIAAAVEREGFSDGKRAICAGIHRIDFAAGSGVPISAGPRLTRRGAAAGISVDSGAGHPGAGGLRACAGGNGQRNEQCGCESCERTSIHCVSPYRFLVMGSGTAVSRLKPPAQAGPALDDAAI